MALDGFTVEVDTGVTGLLGPNGAGKTTLLTLVLGLARPEAGQLEVLGHDPASAGPTVRARLGYSPERDVLPPHVSAADFVVHMARIHGLPVTAARTRAADTLRWVGLGEDARRPLGTLSTGQRQRTLLAQALVHDPDLVLLDEPTAGLDPLERDVLVSSHLLPEIERVADAVVVLRAGRVAAHHLLGSDQATGEVRIEVDGDAGGLAAACTARGLTVHDQHAGRLRVHAPDDRALDTLRDAAVATGASLRRVQREAPALADLYHAATLGGP
ncbi:MAG: ABC transporter [Actinobacteria bacterium QS_8_72_14]|nr:MAG: ABC transporter [Actinobacteria bacterium QS_8_72_14]